MTSSTPSRALRLALTPRWLLALLGLLLLIAAAILLGRWQWDRTQSILDAERAAVAAPVAVEEVYGSQADLPSESIGRTVILRGEYEPAQQSIVTSRELDGKPGVWVVTGLRLADGRTMAVVRGWLPSADDPGARVPSGEVTVEGVLHPDEVFYADAPVTEGTVVSIASPRLAQQWSTPLLSGYVILGTQQPADPPAPLPVPATVQTADVPFPLQNFFYAIQWWIFAAFGIAVYLRWLWIESKRAEVH